MEKLPNQKIFTNKSISIATFFGGPIAAGFLIAKNFKIFGNEKASKNSIFIGIVSTLLLFAALMSLPESTVDKIPQSLIPIIYTAIIFAIVEKFQGDKIKEALENNGEKASGWTAATYGILGLAINLILILAFAFSSPITGYEKQIKVSKNVILHYDEAITDNTPERIAEIVAESGFMEGSEGADLLLSETYRILVLKFILPNESMLKDSALLIDFNNFENYLNYNLNLEKEIVIKFTDPNMIEEYKLPEIPESELMANIYEPLIYLEVLEINENHRIYYNSEMPLEDVKILETAISKLKGYFPVNHAIDLVFLNAENQYILKLFVNRDHWNNKGSINRINSAAEYIRNTGIENEIKVIFIDPIDFSEKEIN